jgi:hypothetical protein
VKKPETMTNPATTLLAIYSFLVAIGGIGIAFGYMQTLRPAQYVAVLRIACVYSHNRQLVARWGIPRMNELPSLPDAATN